MSLVIEARELVRSFGSLRAVDGVSFEVERGAIFGLLGPNGSGKSTIIRMLCGLLAPSSGSCRVLGCEVVRNPERVKPRIGYMSQAFSLYGDLSVDENLHFYGRIYALSAERLVARRAAVLELTGLGDRCGQLAATLSGGWKQRLALACALIHEPELIFLDEPTAGIDPVARRELWDLLFELSGRGVSLFVTTHYMDEAERCSQVAYISDGRLLACGRPEELKAIEAVTPVGTRRYELQVPQPATGLQSLRQLEGVRDATLFGQAIHLLADTELAQPRIVEAAGGRADQSELREIPPTLEDVFVTLSRAARRGELPPLEAPVPRANVEEPPVAEPEERPARASAGLVAVLIKELSHIRREPATIFFMFVVPVVQLFIFGFAIDTEIENIPTVVFDLDGRQAARKLQEAFRNTGTFRIVERVFDQQSFEAALRSGRAKVGIKIPAGYAEGLLRGEQTQVQILIDGSDSQVATTALNTANLLGYQLSVAQVRPQIEASPRAPALDQSGRLAFPIEMRPRLLYNPDLESAHFFVPGLLGVILQLVTLFLTAFTIVRERERGTLEQLFATPVGKVGLLAGKLLPYVLVGCVEMLMVLNLMVFVFGVGIAGSLVLLLALSLLFIICALGLGLLVSTVARTQLQAMQLAFIIMLPSILLSGFMFPRSQMPLPIYLLTFGIPITYFLEILRGVVLRGAGLRDLLPYIGGLLACSLVILGLSLQRFRKQLG